MKKAVIIFAHNLPNQLNVFIDQLLSDKETDVFVHIEKNNDEMKKDIVRREHLFISEKNIRTPWGSDALLNAMLIMLGEVQNKQIDYEYILICSGQDMLVRPDLNEFLESNKGRVFVDCSPSPKEEKVRLFYTWPEKYRKLINKKMDFTRISRRLRILFCGLGIPFFRKKIRYNTDCLKLYKNFFWCAIPFDVCSYVLSFVENNDEFMDIYRGALVAEEGFLGTIIMNSEFADRIEFIDGMSKSLTFTATFKNNHPPVLTKNDIDTISQSGAFFARKFDERVDCDVISYYHNMILESNRKC